MKQQLEKFDAEITLCKDDLTKIYARKDEMREAYFKAKLEYEIEYDSIKQAEHLHRVKASLLEREA